MTQDTCFSVEYFSKSIHKGITCLPLSSHDFYVFMPLESALWKTRDTCSLQSQPLGLGDGVMGKVPALQVEGLEFGSPEPMERWTMLSTCWESQLFYGKMDGRDGNLWKLLAQAHSE